MALTRPKHAVAYHFQNDADTLPDVVTAIRKVYDGPVDFAVDGMVWNVTTEGVRTRVNREFGTDFEFALRPNAEP